MNFTKKTGLVFRKLVYTRKVGLLQKNWFGFRKTGLVSEKLVWYFRNWFGAIKPILDTPNQFCKNQTSFSGANQLFGVHQLSENRTNFLVKLIVLAGSENNHMFFAEMVCLVEEVLEVLKGFQKQITFTMSRRRDEGRRAPPEDLPSPLFL